MPESFEQYRARLLGYLADRDPVVSLRRAPDRIARLLRGRTSRALARRPGPGRWSVVEVLAHLADAEIAWAWRIRQVVATPGVRLQWWDENRWIRRRDCREGDAREHLRLYRALRRGNLALLAAIPRSRWGALHGMHETRGRQTLRDFVVMEAAHDLAHERQIRRTLA